MKELIDGKELGKFWWEVPQFIKMRDKETMVAFTMPSIYNLNRIHSCLDGCFFTVQKWFYG